MPKPFHPQRALSLAAVALSAGLIVALYACYLAFDSQLALAQAADSFMDVFTATVLAWTVAVASRPSDEDHHFGHARAEPIGALIAALVAGVLAVEVARNAIGALVDKAYLRTDWLLVIALSGKAVIKAGIMWFATRLGRRAPSPAMDALRIDARNDVLVCLVSITGFFGTRHGWHALDAIIALPVAAWIAASGVRLARDNIRLLMGEAPPEQRQQEITALAGAVQGVRKAHRIRAHYVGTLVHVHIVIVVDPALSVRQAHDIGEAVRHRVEAEPDVGDCSVHIDIE